MNTERLRPTNPLFLDQPPLKSKEEVQLEILEGKVSNAGRVLGDIVRGIDNAIGLIFDTRESDSETRQHAQKLAQYYRKRAMDLTEQLIDTLSDTFVRLAELIGPASIKEEEEQ